MTERSSNMQSFPLVFGQDSRGAALGTDGTANRSLLLVLLALVRLVREVLDERSNIVTMEADMSRHSVHFTALPCRDMLGALHYSARS